MRPPPRIKICGITRVEDAERAVALGVEAIGINLWPGSSRFVDLERAKALVDVVAGRARTVGVFVDASLEALVRARERTGLDVHQLHGNEPDAVLSAFLPHAYRAVRLKSEEDVERARAALGEEVLVDAFVPQVPGGTGLLVDLALARRVTEVRSAWLAGGLTPENVGAAIEATLPFGVDVASGVESAPGIKDPRRMEAFVRAVRD